MAIIDHEKFSRLWQEDPAEFKRRTRQIIEDFILNIPAERRQKFREMQTIIDAEVEMSGDVIEAFEKIKKMLLEMYDKPGGLRDCSVEAGIIKSKVRALAADTRIRLAMPDGEITQGDEFSSPGP